MTYPANFYIIDDNIFPTEEFKISELEKGISIYEVVKVINNVPLFFEEHLNRLHKSAKIKDLRIWLNDESILKSIQKIIKVNNIKNGRLKFALRYHYSGNKLFCFFLENITPKPEVYKIGIKIISENIERANPNAKVINYKLRKLVHDNKKKENVFETLLISNSGKITECSKSNIFFIKDELVYTSLSKDILKGITRDYIFNICKQKNITLVEKDIFKNEIEYFDAAFISGTSIGVLAVNQINSKLFSVNNKTLNTISDNYFSIVNKYIFNAINY